MTPIELRDKSAALLDRLADRLPAAELEQLRRYNAVGEWGLLVDELAAALVEDGIVVRAGERDALRELLFAFESPGVYRYIARRDEVLGRLVVSG